MVAKSSLVLLKTKKESVFDWKMQIHPLHKISSLL
uniref:Uncharacterized protein n=1 Tax=Anguilla anguilla TaxID=7936 RepID=A0A0E9V0L9_ANGAN